MLAAACLPLVSCIDSKGPLSSPEKAKADLELAGVWRAKRNDGSVQYYHVARTGDKLPAGILRAVSTVHAVNGTLWRPDEMLLFSSDIGNDRYLNIAAVNKTALDQLEKSGWDDKLVQGYFIGKYQVQGDALTIWSIDREAKRRAIQSGKIKGTVEKNDVFFTDTPENVAALLAAPANADLFNKEPIRYERVK